MSELISYDEFQSIPSYSFKNIKHHMHDDDDMNMNMNMNMDRDIITDNSDRDIITDNSDNDNDENFKKYMRIKKREEIRRRRLIQFKNRSTKYRDCDESSGFGGGSTEQDEFELMKQKELERIRKQNRIKKRNRNRRRAIRRRRLVKIDEFGNLITIKSDDCDGNDNDGKSKCSDERKHKHNDESDEEFKKFIDDLETKEKKQKHLMENKWNSIKQKLSNYFNFDNCNETACINKLSTLNVPSDIGADFKHIIRYVTSPECYIDIIHNEKLSLEFLVLQIIPIMENYRDIYDSLIDNINNEIITTNMSAGLKIYLYCYPEKQRLFNRVKTKSNLLNIIFDTWDEKDEDDNFIHYLCSCSRINLEFIYKYCNIINWDYEALASNPVIDNDKININILLDS